MPPLEFASIDVAAVENGDIDAAAALRSALPCGTFYLTNHGVPDALLNRLLELNAAFYALPFDERLQVAAEPETLGGYQPRDRFNETYFATTIRRRTAGIDYSLFGKNRWPLRPPGVEECTNAFIDAMSVLADRLIGAMARAIDLSKSDFDPLFGPSAIHGAQLRYYAPQRPFHEKLDQHSDPNVLAMIVQDEIGGLEGLIDGEWHPIPPVPGTIVCTIGEAMAGWSNDRIGASVHRVIHDKVRERFSLVYTLMPRFDAPMETLAACRDDPLVSRYPPMTCFEFLTSYLRKQTFRDDK